MKKQVSRILAILIALVLITGAVLYSKQGTLKASEDDGFDSAENLQTTEGVSELINIDIPESTEEPAATAEPEATEEPAATAEPEATEEPAATAEPEATEEPAATAEPEATEEPDEESAVAIEEIVVNGIVLKVRIYLINLDGTDRLTIGSNVRLQAVVDNAPETAELEYNWFYSLDGENWTELGCYDDSFDVTIDRQNCRYLWKIDVNF